MYDSGRDRVVIWCAKVELEEKLTSEHTRLKGLVENIIAVMLNVQKEVLDRQGLQLAKMERK